ncbi:MAG: peptide deformylase [Clostridia bacterium]|nr:peptide deformylase [Clostridia bacterium]
MAIRNIVKEGDEVLRKKCREVTEVTDRIRQTMDDMVDTMRDSYGVGLAAPQVGIMRRYFVAEPEPGKVFYMINPVITKQEGNQVCEEGCLSVPGLIGEVNRPQRITITALDRDGKEVTYDLEGFEANVMCHEYDHLDGILFIDKAENIHDPADEEE